MATMECDISGEDAEMLAEVKKLVPCRGKQISTLVTLFGEREFITYPAVFIYGHTATGKSQVINTIMKKFQLPHVFVNCVECYSQRFLYEHILNSLQPGVTSLQHSSSLIKCDNMNDFVRLLKQTFVENEFKETVYIILDKAERLRDMEANILPAFLRLQELTKQNVCVLLLSEIVWEKFRCGTGFCEPLVLHFPDYSKDEVIQILSSECPEEYSDSFYSLYINLVLSVFYHTTRDLKELRHLAVLNFKKYTEPIKSGEATTDDTRKLWRNIEPQLKKALQTVYLREVSSSQWEKYQQESEAGQAVTLQGLSHRSHVELPYYSKYLLIAAYLASYNPAKTDRRFFAKHSGKKTRKSKIVKKHERASNHMLGPKPFPLDRLMAVFYSIVEGRVAPTANIFMQVSSLVSLHFLGHVTGDDQIEAAKYKCHVSLDFIKAVARSPLDLTRDTWLLGEIILGRGCLSLPTLIKQYLTRCVSDNFDKSY